MSQQQYVNDDKRGPDGIGSPHNLHELKNRAGAKFMGRIDVNPALTGKGGSKRAGADYPRDTEKPR